MDIQSIRNYLIRLAGSGTLAILFVLFGQAAFAHAAGVEITGTVTDQNGNTVQNVSITATAPGGTTVEYGPSFSSSDGTYQLDVDPGTYDFHFTPPSGSGFNVVVNPNYTVFTDQVIDVQFTPITYTLSGHVYDSNGNPLSGVNVDLIPTPSGPSASGTTDANGYYSITATEGQYLVNALDNDNLDTDNVGEFGLNQSASPIPVDLTVGNATQNFTLNFVTLQVTVLNADGTPSQNATVQAEPNGGSTSIAPGDADYQIDYSQPDSQSTDASGNASFGAFAGATYPAGSICTYDPTQVCNTTPVTITGHANLTLTLPTYYTLSGYVYDNNGNPLSGVSVGLIPTTSGPGASGSTDANGYYSITTTAGQYVVEFLGYGNYGDTNVGAYGLSQSPSPVPVDLTIGDATQNFTLDLASLQVTVLNADGTPVSLNTTVEELPNGGSTTIVPGSAKYQIGNTQPGTQGTDANGNADFGVLLGATYPAGSICAYGPTSVCNTTPLTITGNSSLTLTFPAYFTLSGYVYDSNGNALPGVYVNIGSSTSGASGVTDADGHYVISAPAGQYVVNSVDSSDTTTDVGEYRLDQSTSPVPVDLTIGDATKNFTLDFATLRVTVLNADGTPVSLNTTVQAEPNGGSTPIAPGAADYQVDYSQNDTQATDANGNADFGVFLGAAYPAGSICAYGPTQVCNTTPLTVTGNASLVFQEQLSAPAAPTGFSAVTPTNNAPALTWNPAVTAVNYWIYRDGVQIGTSATPNYVDSSLTADGSYSYTVAGVNSDGIEGPQSTPLTVVYDTTPPVLGMPSWSANPITAGQTTNLLVLATDNLSGVVGGEYYIGSTDPGEGNGTPMPYDGTNLTASLGSNLSPGAYAVNVRAEDATGSWSAVTTTDLVINPAGTAPAFTSTSTAIAGTNAPFSFTIATTGSPAPALTYQGSLPTGLTFTDNGDGTATIGGTITGSQGTYLLAITATNVVGTTAQDFVLYVSPVTITSASSDTESFGAPFSFTVTTTGNPAPSISKTGGLPPGVTFTNNGNGTATIAGTPDGTASGPYTLTIKATNSQGSATQMFVLSISKAPVIKKIPNKTTHVGTAFSMTITTTGSVTPSISATGLPSGLTLTDNGNGIATIAGTPAVGSGAEYFVTVAATSSLGSASQAFTIKNDEGPTITSTCPTTATIGSTYTCVITATGYPAPSITKTGPLPHGVTFKGSTQTFSGTPGSNSAGSYPITITAKNSTGSMQQSFTLTAN